jgi:hypothetical protein
MQLDEAVTVLAGWLDQCDVKAAPQRVEELLERNNFATAQRDSEATAAFGELPFMLQRRHPEDDAALVRIALHESAHATCAVAMGLAVERVLIHSGGGSAAYGHGEASPDTHNLARIAATLAGPAWELLGPPLHPWRMQQLKTGHDVLAARLRLDEQLLVTSRTAATLAVCVVFSNTEAILRVADALLSTPSGELAGARVHALCWAGPKDAQV